MIWIGIDDTDTLDTPGTNQLARALVARLTGSYTLVRIVRHQLLFDPRVPYTSKNGSASIVLTPIGTHDPRALIADLRAGMLAWFVPGSDPGLCVAEHVPDEVIAYGRRCQREIIRHEVAREVAARCGMHLEGLGGTQDGVIGALAAVGLIAGGDDGRVIHLGEWPDDLTGPQPIAALLQRGVNVRRTATEVPVRSGLVNVGKRLRPNVRRGATVLYVDESPSEARDAARWQAVKLT